MIRSFADGATPSLRLRGPFLVLVLTLLVSVGVSTVAGLVGITHLDRVLHQVADTDAKRLITVTHIRRLFRSELVLSRELALSLDPPKRQELVQKREDLRGERAIMLDRLSRLGVLGQAEELEALRRDHELFTRDASESGSHWEGAVAAILAATERQLSRAAADAEAARVTARTELVWVSAITAICAFGLGGVVLRRVRNATETLSEREAHFRTVVQSAPSLLTILAPNGELLYLPPRAPVFLGIPGEQLVREPMCWIVGDDRQALEAQVAGAAAGTTQDGAVRVRAKRSDGSVWHAACSVTPLFEAGRNVSGIILQILDVSRRVKAEQAQTELEAQLRQAQKMESVGRLAGGIAHDFNNLLTAIKGFATMAQEEPQSPELPEFIDSILSAADRASELTRQLLTFSRKYAISPVPTDLGILVRGIEKLLVRVLGEDVRLEIKVEEGLGQCLVDKNQVEQAIMNLAINARQAMPKGGRLLIEVGNAEIGEAYVAKHAGVSPGSYILLSVSDTGIGMSKEVQERVFEPFFTTKPVGQGTGLGLSVVHGTVHQHGGAIDLYSEPGLGTTFRIYWPRIEAKGEAAPLLEGTPARSEGHELILLVEDESLVRTVAAKSLARQGYRVLAAETAHEAKVLMESATEVPDLLFTDVILPDQSGPELALELRQRFPELPVLYASGYSGKLMTDSGHLPPDVDYLQKPYDTTTLARRVRAALDRGVKGSESSVSA